jgi:hypothetical protein
MMFVLTACQTRTQGVMRLTESFRRDGLRRAIGRAVS